MSKSTNSFIGITVILGIIGWSCGGNESSNKSDNQSSSPSTYSQNTIVVNINNVSDCANYLKGKSFSGGSARIEFSYDGNASVYNNTTNTLALDGTLELGGIYHNQRILLVQDVSGSGELKYYLGGDGKLMDASDFTIYKQ